MNKTQTNDNLSKVNQELCRQIIADYNNKNFMKSTLCSKYYAELSVHDFTLLYNYDAKKKTDILDYLCGNKN